MAEAISDEKLGLSRCIAASRAGRARMLFSQRAALRVVHGLQPPRSPAAAVSPALLPLTYRYRMAGLSTGLPMSSSCHSEEWSDVFPTREGPSPTSGCIDALLATLSSATVARSVRGDEARGSPPQTRRSGRPPQHRYDIACMSCISLRSAGRSRAVG